MRRRSLLRRVDREATAKPPTRVRAVLAKLLRNGVRSPSLSLRVCSRTARTTDKRRVCEGDGVGLVGAVELYLAGRRVVRPEQEVDGLHRRLLVRRTRLREETLLDAVRVRDDDRRAVVVLGLVERVTGLRQMCIIINAEMHL